MIQCSQCEHFIRGGPGQIRLTCDPFSTVKEPECLAKWQLIKIDLMVQAYHATLDMYRRLAPLQEKMFRHMEREIDDIDESDRWKVEDEDDDSPDGPADRDKPKNW